MAGPGTVGDRSMNNRGTVGAGNGIEIARRTPANGCNVPFTAAAPYDAGAGRDVRVVVEARHAGHVRP